MTTLRTAGYLIAIAVMIIVGTALGLGANQEASEKAAKLKADLAIAHNPELTLGLLSDQFKDARLN